VVIGYGNITLRLHECRSLKSKRSIVKSIIHQVRNHFNASVAEVGSNDIHKRAEIGFALVGNSRNVVNAKIDKILNMVDDLGLAEIIDAELEIMNFIRKKLSSLAMPQEIEYVPSLPKTRSGKIMRRLLRAQEWGEEIGDISTLEND
jgi:uncharacterized protein YlxP (DUF503 family)